MALTVVHMYQRVSQIWQTRGGRKTVTKANNRKHKTRTAKTLGMEPFSVGKTKENKTQAKASFAADNRSPCRRSAVLYRCSESYTAHCHRSEKVEISCSNSFCGLIFQVLRTQRSSVSITLTVSKQKEQKLAFRRWVFLGRMQPAIHPTCTHVQKCPADPDRRHFVNSPHCCFPQARLVAAIIFPHTKWLPKITDYRDTAALKVHCYAIQWFFAPFCCGEK